MKSQYGLEPTTAHTDAATRGVDWITEISNADKPLTTNEHFKLQNGLYRTERKGPTSKHKTFPNKYAYMGLNVDFSFQQEQLCHTFSMQQLQILSLIKTI